MKVAKDDTFLISYKDVRCWGSHVNFQGTLQPGTKAGLAVPENTKMYDLVVDPFYGSIEPFPIAFMQVDKAREVARLTIDGKYFGNNRGEAYHLSCEKE